MHAIAARHLSNTLRDRLKDKLMTLNVVAMGLLAESEDGTTMQVPGRARPGHKSVRRGAPGDPDREVDPRFTLCPVEQEAREEHYQAREAGKYGFCRAAPYLPRRRGWLAPDTVWVGGLLALRLRQEGFLIVPADACQQAFSIDQRELRWPGGQEAAVPLPAPATPAPAAEATAPLPAPEAPAPIDEAAVPLSDPAAPAPAEETAREELSQDQPSTDEVPAPPSAWGRAASEERRRKEEEDRAMRENPAWESAVPDPAPMQRPSPTYGWGSPKGKGKDPQWANYNKGKGRGRGSSSRNPWWPGVQGNCWSW